MTKKRSIHFKHESSGFGKFSAQHQADIEEFGMLLELLTNNLLTSKDLETKIATSLSLMKETLDINIEGILRYFLNNLSEDSLVKIEQTVERIEHMAYLFPAETPLDLLSRLATQAGFPDHHQTFPSTIVAKELGVPTTIFKASGKNRKGQAVSIEVFIPNASAEQVKHWISEGICRHIALRMKNHDNILQIHHILSETEPDPSSFKFTEPMVNKNENSATIYYDKNIHDYILRLEFFYN